ncbi:neuroglobin-like [Centruroides sculpturatus]|uniref:neuroglobin-like n=1 Tax=Centruroides sculpturatus TaxID=218467 RepID=UPI000C6E3835|nr:neuroglobin-like [Centruroides sculpturatus]
MGTSLSKGSYGFSKKGQDGISPLDDPPIPAAPDPRLPLTARQRFSISKSWKGISRAMESTGINMFIKLFEDNEDILHLFKKFQYLKTHEQQRDSMELAQHASIVMSTLDEGIRSLDNMDYFLDYLHSVGKLHRKIQGFNRDLFWKIEKPFLSAVQETLGDRYTDNMDSIYKVTIRFILETVIKGYDMAEDETNGTPSEENDV